MLCYPLHSLPTKVALHPEGVDRNLLQAMFTQHTWVALHPEGVDRNVKSGQPRLDLFASPSTRRAWIEIMKL